MIKLIDVHKSFGKQAVLNGVNLEIEDGKTTVIIGKSGGGKSVLLKHIIGLLQPDSGQILIDDLDITKLDEKGLNETRKKFGMLFQEAALFDSMTVGENVAFPLREHTKLKDEEIRQTVADRLPVWTPYGRGYPLHTTEVQSGSLAIRCETTGDQDRMEIAQVIHYDQLRPAVPWMMLGDNAG